MKHNYGNRGSNDDAVSLSPWRPRRSITRNELTILVAFLLCGMSNTGQPCRHVFSSERGSVGEFTSPGYPNEYSPHIHCEYVFSGTKDERIKIEFMDFDLERGTSAGCLFDYIEVFTIDNDNMMNHEIRLCGNAIPQPFVSVHQRLEIVFKSDYAGSRRGFRGRYHFLHETVNLFPNNTDGCGDNFLRGSGGEITSPGFPNPYPGNVKCLWTIRVEHDMTIVLNFVELDLGPSTQCKQTYVAIYNGFAHPTKDPPKFCKQSAENKEYKSKSFRVVVRFESGPVNELLSKGFRMIWTAVWIPQTSPDGRGISPGERCEGFHCKGEEYCIDTSKVLCNPLPRYCISQSLRCNGVPNCGASDLSDEEGCLTSAVLLVSAAGGGAVTAIVVIVTATVLCRRHRRRLAISEVNGTKQHHRNHRRQQQQQKQADHRNSETKSGQHPTTSTNAPNQLPTDFENGDGRAVVCVSADPLLIEQQQQQQQQQRNTLPPSARRCSGGTSSSRRPSLARALAVDSGTDFEAKSTTGAPRRDSKPSEVPSGRSNGNIKLSGAVDRINMTGYVMTSGGNGASKCLPSRYYSTVSSTFQACGGGSGPGGGIQESIAAYRPLNDFQYEFDDDVDDCVVDEADFTGENRTIVNYNANGRVHRGDKGSPYFGRTDATAGHSYHRQGSVGTGGRNLAPKRSRSIELRRHHQYQDHYQQRQQRQMVQNVDIEPEMTYIESYSDDRRSWHSGLANAGDIADEMQSPEFVVGNRNGGGSLRSATTRSGTDRRSASTRSRSAASSLRQLNGQSRHETVSGTASSTSNETPATSRRFASCHGPYHAGGSANGQVEFPPSLGFSIGQQIVVARHHLQIHVEPPDRRYASTGRINQLINPVLTQPQQKMELDLLCPKPSPRTRECRAVGGINSGGLRSQTLKGTSSVV